MTSTEIVAPPSMILADARDTCLRATWHRADHVVVMSHWRGGACVSTFRLAATDVERLTHFFVGVLGEDQQIG